MYNTDTSGIRRYVSFFSDREIIIFEFHTKVSAISDILLLMTHLNFTVFSASIAEELLRSHIMYSLYCTSEFCALEVQKRQSLRRE